MENKNVGYLVLGISLAIIAIIFVFNSALKTIVNQSCTMAGHDGCQMYDTITQQTYLALAIVAVIIFLGLFLVFSKQSERIIVKNVEKKKEKKEYDLSGLRSEEKQVFNLVKESGTIFQADIIEKTQIGKAKVSRIIDRLEGRGLVERRRRGMTNVVVLKD